jgi:peptidoglycan hydrolase CwlO-like protein
MENIVFNTKDVIAIVTFVVALVGHYFTFKKEVQKLEIKQQELEKAIDKVEDQASEKIQSLRFEQKNNYDVIQEKLKHMDENVNQLNKTLSELVGFLKGKEIK